MLHPGKTLGETGPVLEGGEDPQDIFIPTLETLSVTLDDMDWSCWENLQETMAFAPIKINNKLVPAQISLDPSLR